MTAPLLTLAGVGRRYGALAAVDRVDLTVRGGERHALIGPNGAGKSTLLALIAGNDLPTAGRITLDGRDITTAGPVRRARAGIGRTFQQPAVAHSLTAVENVALGAWRHRGRLRPGRRAALRRLCLEELDRVGAADLADRPAGALSHGQRRLVELASVLAGRPRLLLLDEPAAGLTDTESERLLTVLRQLPAEVALVLVEHDLAFVGALAGLVTVLHEGRLLAHGTPAAIGADQRVRAVYLGTREL